MNDKINACDMKRWRDLEAKRCLAKKGPLSARLSDLRKVITGQGFEIYADEERGDFTFIDARKL